MRTAISFKRKQQTAVSGKQQIAVSRVISEELTEDLREDLHKMHRVISEELTEDLQVTNSNSAVTNSNSAVTKVDTKILRDLLQRKDLDSFFKLIPPMYHKVILQDYRKWQTRVKTNQLRSIR